MPPGRGGDGMGNVGEYGTWCMTGGEAIMYGDMGDVGVIACEN